MAAGRLTLLFLLISLTIRADRASDCSEQTTMRLVGCGGSEANDIQDLYDDKQCEKPDQIIYTELTIDPLTSARWRIERATLIMDPALVPGKLEGNFVGPYEQNSEGEINIKIHEPDGASPFIKLEKLETRSDGKFKFDSCEVPVSQNALKALEGAAFVININNKENTNKLEIKKSMDAFAKLLRHKQAACNAIGKAGDTTSAPDDESTVSPDASSIGNSSSALAGSSTIPTNVISPTVPTLRPTASMLDASAKRKEKAFPLAMAVGGAVGGLVIIVILVTIVIVCVKRAKERKKVEVPANYVLDRNSKPKETWDQRKEKDRAVSKKRKILESLKRRQKQAQIPSTSTPSTNVASFTPSDSDMKQAEDSLGSYDNTTVNNTTTKNSLGSFNQ